MLSIICKAFVAEDTKVVLRWVLKCKRLINVSVRDKIFSRTVCSHRVYEDIAIGWG